jgi:6-phosphogluconolactonase
MINSYSWARRVLVVLAGLYLAPGPLSVAWAEEGACGPGSRASELVYFGTHTQNLPNATMQEEATGHGIFAARLDARTGHLRSLGPVAEVDRPTWIVADPTRPILYSVSEMGNDGRTEDSVFAFAVDPASGTLRPLSKTSSGGSGATHLAVDPASHTLFVAHFGSGQVSALPILADGSLAAVASVRRDYGFGPNPRQKSPHAHAVAVDPSNHFVLVADLGADRIFVYRFDVGTRQLSQADPAFAAVTRGAGPRHLVFHPNGRFLFLDTELSAQLLSFRWDAHRGRLHLLQTLATMPPDYQGPKSAAEIRVSHDGRFVYVSNRGDDTIVGYSVNPRTGMLSEIQRIPSGGKTPWSFELDATGRWLLAANEASSTVTVLGIDPQTGQLRATSETLPVPKPVSVTFLSVAPCRD